MPDAGEKVEVKFPERMNLAEWVVDRNAERYGEKIAVICVGSKEMGIDEGKVSFNELKALTNKTANALAYEGMSFDDRVLIVLPDSIEFYLSFYGAIKLGAIPIPVNTYLFEEDYAYYFEDSRAKYAFIFSKFEEALKAAEKSKFLKAVFDEEDLKRMIKNQPENFEPLKLSKDSMAFWLYSSGTTGKPKGVVHLQHDPIFVCESYHRRVLGISSEDICYSVSKLFFAYGLGSCGYGSLYFGATAVVDPERPNPERAVEILEKYGVTVLFTVPSFYARLAEIEREVKHKLRIAVSGGEPLPEAVWYKFKEKFGVEIVEHIGSTEALYAFIGHYPGKVKPGYTGVVMPGWEVKLVDEEGNEIVKDGVPGKLLIKGDSVAAFYWEKHDKTKKTFLGEWYDTGDTFVREGKFYRYYGRADDLIKTRGLWVSPVKVENALLKHPAIEECAVVQGFNEKKLEVVAAYVVLRKGYDKNVVKDVKDFLRKQGLKGFEIPEKWVFVKELPRTATGKIQKYKLRMKEFEEAFGK
ncbi:benzoate-CoA ligase family protein [Ferroglobus sp.]|uniref:benzoate-CoA ligase family protein n=1 Tax=Ferroglobus sp. TaxID=2614230 RepID=UPI0025B8CE4B|nr:benzoate-CoA ligase family protein [Ferroglobus sp.]